MVIEIKCDNCLEIVDVEVDFIPDGNFFYDFVCCECGEAFSGETCDNIVAKVEEKR